MSERTGFTLLELMLASALMVVLMVGVMAVIGSTFDSRAAAEPAGTNHVTDAPDHDAAERFAQLLHEDLRHARAMDAADDGSLVLIGYAALDSAGRGRVHRPVRITYRIESIDGRSWLIRSQAALDVATNQNLQHDLIAVGIGSFDLEKVMIAAPASSAPAIASPARPPEESDPKQTSDDEGDTPIVMGELDDGSMMINGSWYYKEYIPEWAKPAKKRPDQVRGAGADNDPNSVEATASAGSNFAAGTKSIWQLRVYGVGAEPGDEQAFEKTLILSTRGGL